MNYPNSGMQSGIFSDVKDVIYKLGSDLVELTENTKNSWKKYLLSNIDTVANNWDYVETQHHNLIQYRTSMELPIYDSVKSPESWTVDDETQFGQMFELVKKITSYGEELRNGKREIAWETTKEDVALLGTAQEVAIAVNQKSDFIVSAGGNVSTIQTIPNSVGQTVQVVVLVSVLTIGVTLIVLKYLDDKKDQLARASVRDLQAQQTQIYVDCKAEGSNTEKCVKMASGLTDATSRAIKTQEEAIAEGKNADPLMSTVKTVSLVVLGVSAIGGAIYLISRLPSRSSSSYSQPSLPEHAGA